DADTSGAADGDEVLVELAHDPRANGSWADDMAAMLNLFGSEFTQQFGTPRRGDPAAALAQARVEQSGRTIVVHAPDARALRGITLNATIHAPAGSDLSGTSSAGDITVTGTAGRCETSTGSGAVTLAGTSDYCRARTGSGQLRLGTVQHDLTVRSSSGAVEVSGVSGSANVVTGSGAAWFGE